MRIYYDWKAFKHYVEENFEWSDHNWFRLSSINGEDINYFLHLDCSISISMCHGDSVNLIFDSSSDSEALKVLKKKFRQLDKSKKTQRIGVIRSRGGGFGVKFFEYKLLENDFTEYMGEDLQRFYKDMVGDLQSDYGKGLYLLYGKPDNSSSVSNLLNLTDGFLSDFLNLKIICTYNTDLTNIDSALLRNGRLRGMYEFKAPDSQKVQKIASFLDKELPSKPMTIAEICNPDKNDRKNGHLKIGFSK